jgi:hypothetical protein
VAERSRDSNIGGNVSARMKRMMAVVRERVMRRIVVRVRVMVAARLREVEEVNERCGRWWWEMVVACGK